jgi:ubiquinone/menaquinone biosynthesis C-methylase UbiE
MRTTELMCFAGATLLSQPLRLSLDVGCGTGFSAFNLWRQTSTDGVVVGIDTDREKLVQASRMFDHHQNMFFVRSSLEDMAHVCVPHVFDTLQLQYCLTDVQFPSLDELYPSIDVLLHDEGVVKIVDYSPRFVQKELYNDGTVEPLYVSTIQKYFDIEKKKKNTMSSITYIVRKKRKFRLI